MPAIEFARGLESFEYKGQNGAPRAHHDGMAAEDGKTSYLYWSIEESCPDYTTSSFESDSNLDSSDSNNIGESSSRIDNLNESQNKFLHLTISL